MKNTVVHNSSSLTERLSILKQERQQLEGEIARGLSGIVTIIKDPVPYAKEAIRELALDKNVQQDLLKAGIYFAADYVIDKYIYKKTDGFLSGLLNKFRETESENKNGDVLRDILNIFTRKKRNA
jgi:hypothetical protein